MRTLWTIIWVHYVYEDVVFMRTLWPCKWDVEWAIIWVHYVLWGRCVHGKDLWLGHHMSTLCSGGHYVNKDTILLVTGSSYEYVMFYEDVMFMRTLWPIIWVHYIYEDVMFMRTLWPWKWGVIRSRDLCHKIIVRLRYVIKVLCSWN